MATKEEPGGVSRFWLGAYVIVGELVEVVITRVQVVDKDAELV